MQQFVALHRDLPFVEMLTVWFLLLVYQIEHVQAIAQLKQNYPYDCEPDHKWGFANELSEPQALDVRRIFESGTRKVCECAGN